MTKAVVSLLFSQTNSFVAGAPSLLDVSELYINDFLARVHRLCNNPFVNIIHDALSCEHGWAEKLYVSLSYFLKIDDIMNAGKIVDILMDAVRYLMMKITDELNFNFGDREFGVWASTTCIL